MFDHQDKSTFPNGRNAKQPVVPVISPSLMVADQTKLLEGALHVISNEGGASEWLHVDVVDGHFAPNFSFCPGTVADLRRHMPHVFLDCHLMVTDPMSWIEPFAKAGASSFVFHYESTEDPVAVCRKVRAAGMVAGVAIRHSTPAKVLFPLLDAGEADMALVMCVPSGFAGQVFRPEAVENVRALRQRYPTLLIQVDGSITLDTIDLVASAGANAIVPGRAVFKAADRKANTDKLRGCIQKYIDQRAAKSHL